MEILPDLDPHPLPVDPSTLKRKRDDDDQHQQQAMAGHSEQPMMRRKSTTAYVTLKTIVRWRNTGAVDTEYIQGFSSSSTKDEQNQAEEMLQRTGQIVCNVCHAHVNANKKSIQRHQRKNRKHLRILGEFPADSVGSSRTRSSRAQNKLLEAAKEAWGMLKEDSKVLDCTLLNLVLANLGICDEKDLSYCDETELREIACTLKKVPQRRFLGIFNMQALPPVDLQQPPDDPIEHDHPPPQQMPSVPVDISVPLTVPTVQMQHQQG
jgi:hypothetical protein